MLAEANANDAVDGESFLDYYWRMHVLGVVNQSNISFALNIFHKANETFQQKNRKSLEKLRNLCLNNSYSILQNPSVMKGLQFESLKDVLKWYAADRSAMPEAAKNLNIDQVIHDYCQDTIVDESNRESIYQELKATLIEALNESNNQE